MNDLPDEENNNGTNRLIISPHFKRTNYYQIGSFKAVSIQHVKNVAFLNDFESTVL